MDPAPDTVSMTPDEPARSVVSLNELGAINAFVGAIRTRIVGGLILALPIAITFFILYQLYLTLQNLLIGPVTWLIQRAVGDERIRAVPPWLREIGSPLIAIASVLVLLYFLGLFVKTRLFRTVDWVMTRVPLVTTIYQSVRGIFQSLGGQKGAGRFKRVVSVAYPHPGLRVPGFVTKSMRDVASGRTILSVFVPFAPLPTSGFVLLVAEDDVVDLGWTVNETMQGIVSGGLSMPETLRFAPAPPSGAGSGPTR